MRSHRSARQLALLVLWLLLAACAPTTKSDGQSPATAPQSARATRPLVIIIAAEPAALHWKPLVRGGVNLDTPKRLFNANLALLDERRTPHPYLVDAFPQLNGPDWRVQPDGRMETTYRLRPNLTWHDGTPLSAQDFVFGWRMYTHPELGLAGSPPQNLIDEALAPDDQTLMLRWRQPYPDAGTLAEEFPPMPRHILESTFERGSADALGAHPFWTTAYVGLGPYSLTRWENGAFMEATAFAGHALGRPRIDRVKLLFVRENNAIVANLLAGEADYVSDTAIRYQQAATLRREWEPRKGGTAVGVPAQVRFTQVQFRPEYLATPALLNRSVRRALAHAIDRQAQIDALYEGQGLIADTFVDPKLDFFPLVDRAIMRYPFDPRRTEQLMAEAGYSRGSSGYYEHPTDGRFSPELNIHGGQAPTELAVMSDNLHQVGIDVQARVIDRILLQDQTITATFKGLRNGSHGDITRPPELTTAAIPSPQNRWIGANGGGFSNPEYDRLYEAFMTTLDRNERGARIAETLKLLSEEAPYIPRYYDSNFDAWSSALTGPIPGGRAFNVHEWELKA